MTANRSDEQRSAERPEDAAAASGPETEAMEDGATAAAGAADGTEATAPASRLAELEAEVSAARDRYLRLAAEYDNYRKRTDRERGETALRAQAQLVEQLLEPLDDLQRVAHFSSGATLESVLEGVQMVERKLLRVLESAGLEPIEARGQAFDPARHEALMTTAAESEAEDDSIAEVFQAGYQFQGVLLRPARVQVKKYHG